MSKMNPYISQSNFNVFLIPTSILTLLSLLMLYLVFPKKKMLKDKFKNMSYCVISDYILTLIFRARF